MSKSANGKHKASQRTDQTRKQNIADGKISILIDRIKKHRQNGDLPNVLKEIKYITRKPIAKITELKGGENKNIAGLSGIRKNW